METLIGFELCTAGSAERISVNGTFTVEPGMLIIQSPAFPMIEINRSGDYHAVLLQDAIENFLPVISQALSLSTVPAIIPYMQLTDEQQAHFLQSVARIRGKELELRDLTHPVQQKIQTTVITLLRQATLLEYAQLFSGQLLHQPKPLSHKRQVMMTFLMMLNTEYRQHRTVQYYAEKQSLTPRHFADIIKQESGYTPMEWINMITINQAKNLLRQPDTQVKDVAAQLGFPEQFTFRKYFKTHTGMSPTEYQRI